MSAGFSWNQRNTGGPRSASATARSLKKIDRRYSGSVSLVDELLKALPFVSLRNVNVAFGIGRDVLGAIELTGPVSATAEFTYQIQRFTANDPYHLIRSIRNNEEALSAIGGKRDIPHGSTSKRLLRKKRFSDERAILLENLNAIVCPIANVNEPVSGDPGGMHNAELWWRRAGRIILAGAVLMLDSTIDRNWIAHCCVLSERIIRVSSIRAPLTFVRSGLSIEHDDSMIQVSIGDVEFVRRFIDDQRGRTAEILCVIASAVSSAVANLHEEFSVVSEFKNLIVLLPSPGKPDVVLRIHIYAVLQLWPFISFAGAAP